MDLQHAYIHYDTLCQILPRLAIRDAIAESSAGWKVVGIISMTMDVSETV